MVVMPLRDIIIVASRLSNKAGTSLVEAKVGTGVPADAVDPVVVPVDVRDDEAVVGDVSEVALAVTPVVELMVDWAVVPDAAPLTETPTLPHNCAVNSETSAGGEGLVSIRNNHRRSDRRGLRKHALDVCRRAVLLNNWGKCIDEGSVFADANEIRELAAGRADA